MENGKLNDAEELTQCYSKHVQIPSSALQGTENYLRPFSYRKLLESEKCPSQHDQQKIPGILVGKDPLLHLCRKNLKSKVCRLANWHHSARGLIVHYDIAYLHLRHTSYQTWDRHFWVMPCISLTQTGTTTEG
jgi:hypothetical protein